MNAVTHHTPAIALLGRHWLGAVALAMLLHLVGLWLLNTQRDAPVGEKGSSMLRISLGGAPHSAVSTAPAASTPTPPTAQPRTASPVSAAAPMAASLPEPHKKLTPAQSRSAQAADPGRPVAATAITPRRVHSRSVPRAADAPPAATASAQTPTQLARRLRTATAELQRSAEQPVSKRPVQEPRNSSPAAQRPANAGAGSNTSTYSGERVTPGNLTASVLSEYLSELRRSLERHKRYPIGARRRRIQGTADLTLVVAANGEVLNARLARSAGDRRLDQAALRMVERAGRLPPLPPELERSQLELRVPVSFQLR